MRCPICKKHVPDPGPNGPVPAFYPFCSDRCRLIDLNRWLTGRYQIPGVEGRDDEEPNRTPRDDD